MIKIKQDNDVIDCIGVVYDETETELLNLSNKVRYVAKTRQDNDMINHTSAVYTKQNSIVVTSQTGCNLWQKPDRTTTWPIV